MGMVCSELKALKSIRYSNILHQKRRENEVGDVGGGEEENKVGNSR